MLPEMLCLIKLGSCVDSSKSLPACLECAEYLLKDLLWWYAWKGRSLWLEWCFEAYFLMMEIFAGIKSWTLPFYLKLSVSLRSLMEDSSYFTFIARVFFSLRSSFTSQVRLTVSLFNLTIIVLLILSSIFRRLFVFTTCLIKWSLFYTAYYTRT
jgi:hypothetical protein